MARIHVTGDAPEIGALFPDMPHRTQVHTLWTSAEAILRHLPLDRPATAWDGDGWERGDPAFFGTRTFRQAFDLCAKGWPEGADIAMRLRERINAEHPRHVRVTRYDVAGERVDIGRYLGGAPDYMLRASMARSRRRPVLTLVSDIGVLANVDSQAMLNRAAVVTAVIDAIEDAGFSCHVLAYSTSSTGQTLTRCGVTLKDPGQPADIGRLAFGLGHAAMLRRMVFALRGEDKRLRDLGPGLGRTISLAPTPDMAAQGVYVALGCDGPGEKYFATADKAATIGLEYILNSLRAQGCPAFVGEGDTAIVA